ncbi:MAG: DNA-processing protein DprA [Thermoanaerobaculia bacterium]
MSNEHNDLERGLGWALLARGRSVRALRRLLLYAGSGQRVLGLTLEAALEIAQEPLECVAPLLKPHEAPGLAGQLERLRKASVVLVDLCDPEYPPLLREINDPPPILFRRGRPLPTGPAIAVVGARRASRAGLEAARLLSRQLAEAGAVVVSGFARGVDAAAHAAALEAGGATIAVLGCGADVCYPPEQSKLFAAMLESGTVLSEFPLGTAPQPHQFPIRNRVIAGLSRITLVVEAAEKSGSLITARCALDYGRDVAAVPGSILSPLCAGSNALLKDGAILVRSVEDLLGELPDQERGLLLRSREESCEGTVPALASARLSPDAQALFAALDADEPRDPDALAAHAGLGAARFSAALFELELEGFVIPLPGALFVRNRAKS